MEQLGEIDQFVARTRKQADSLIITIPKNIVKFSGMKEGHVVKFWFKILKDGLDEV